MENTHVALSLIIDAPGAWYADWAWGLPLIALTVVIHAFGLLLINEWVARIQNVISGRCSYRVMFQVIIAAAAMLVTLLHGLEGMIWAAAYWLLDALPDYSSAALYSLGAMTTYGHTNLVLEKRWQLMGTLEALTGMLLFGLTTAILIGIIQRFRKFPQQEI